jgi:hypothetical protein
MDIGLLIIKLMPSGENQAAFLSLASEVNRKLRGMGLPLHSLYPPLGPFTFSPWLSFGSA